MNLDHLQRYLDLHADTGIDPEIFAAALAVKHVEMLIAGGGSSSGRPDLETALDPERLESFLTRAVETAQRNRRFEREWRWLQQAFPPMKVAWQRGQALFQQDLREALADAQHMEYLSVIDYAARSYASAAARAAYLLDRTLQAWTINGYM